MIDILIRGFKILWISLWATLATIIISLPITIAVVVDSTGNMAFNLSKVWAWVMLIVIGAWPVIKGREKIKKGQSYIIISNHQSHYDGLALVTKLGVQFRWIIKKELRKVPLFGYDLWVSKNIFIDRSDTKKSVESINEGMKRLPDGTSVMVFAEGTRSPDGKIHPFKKGGFIMAIDGGIPILPVTVSGGRKILPKGSLVFSPGPMEVVVADSIDTQDCTRKDLEELMQRTRNMIIANFKPDYPEVK